MVEWWNCEIVKSSNGGLVEFSSCRIVESSNGEMWSGLVVESLNRQLVDWWSVVELFHRC